MTIDDALRMELADRGSPEALLECILTHRPDWSPPVDVEVFAREVGIIEFRTLEVDGFVGALMTDLEKSKGVILTAEGLRPSRRRFTIAHELGHFLIPMHRGDKRCSAVDLAQNGRATLHQKEEAQANRFAAGLLMPKAWFKEKVDALGSPDLGHLQQLVSIFKASTEAVANRYAELSAEQCAVVMIKGDRIRYARPSRSFPALSVGSGDRMPATPQTTTLSRWSDTPAREWLRLSYDERAPPLRVQVLNQGAGHQVVLLHIDEEDDDEDREEHDLAERYHVRFR